MENGDPETTLEVVDLGNDKAEVRVQVLLTRNCAECGVELKEYNYDFTRDTDIPTPAGDHQHELLIDEESSDVDERARYKKDMIKVVVSWVITCSGCDMKVEGFGEDSASASSFEDLV